MSNLPTFDQGIQSMKIDGVQDNTFQSHISTLYTESYAYIPKFDVAPISSLRKELKQIRAMHPDLYEALAKDSFS